MSRLASSLGAGVGALVAASLVGIVAGALYLRTQTSGKAAVIKVPAAAHAGQLARITLASTDDPSAVQAAVEKSFSGAKDLRFAAVVMEPTSVKYRFLRKRRYLAHTDPARVRQVLDKRHAGDKSIYDVANLVRKDGPQVALHSPVGAKPFVRAAVPVMVEGKHRATALVVMEPRPPVLSDPAWPLAQGVLLCVLLALVAGAINRRLRYLALLLAVGTLAFHAYSLLASLAGGLDRDLTQQVQQFVTLFGVTRAEVVGQFGASGIPSGGIVLEGLWALGLATILAMGVCLLGLLNVGQRMTHNLVKHRFAYGYVTPAAVGMLLLVFVPFGYGLGLGFFRHDHGSYTFVGLANFVEILTGGGHPLGHPLNFYFTLGVTVLWTVCNVVLHVSIGLGLALLLKDPLMHFKGVYRVLLILPWAVPNYITALIWKGMFHQQFGAVNYVLGTVGVEKVSWWSDFSTAFIANVTTNTWLGFPFMMVVSLGALQSIPDDVYEAAAVDGASKVQSFFHITLPLLRPALFPAIVLGSIWTFNMFNIIWLVSEGQPGGASDILITEAYRWAFERADRYGLSAAYALVIFVILFGYTVMANRLSRATEESY